MRVVVSFGKVMKWGTDWLFYKTDSRSNMLLVYLFICIISGLFYFGYRIQVIYYGVIWKWLLNGAPSAFLK